MFLKGFHANASPAAPDEITFRKPRTILVVIAWGITSASVLLNVFLSGSQMIGYAFWSISTMLPTLLLFFLSVFAGMLLEDIKSIILGIFEALALTILLTYGGITLPALIGNAPSVYANLVYTTAIYKIFTMLFPVIPLCFLVGAIIGGFVREWQY